MIDNVNCFGRESPAMGEGIAACGICTGSIEFSRADLTLTPAVQHPLPLLPISHRQALTEYRH